MTYSNEINIRYIRSTKFADEWPENGKLRIYNRNTAEEPDKPEKIDEFRKINLNEDLYRQIFRHSVIPVIVHDIEMNIIDANDSAVDEFGYGKKQLLDKKVFALHTDDQLEASADVLSKMKTEDKLSLETKFKRKDGSVFLAKVTPCKYIIDGTPIIHVYIQDITEQARTRQELEKSSQAIASSMDGISRLNPDGKFVYLNRAFASLYGYSSPDELLDETWKILYRESDSEYFEENVLPQIIREGRWRGETVGKRKNGSIFYQEVSLSSTADGGMICVVRDITERKEYQQKTEQALKEKKTLLKEVHHRVKNNLSIISSLLELKKFEPVESVEALIEDTQSRINSISLIHEKLYQSKTLSDVDVREYIEEFSEVILTSFNSDQKNIVVNKDLQSFNLNTRRAVPLGLIVNELLSNAFKHGFSGVNKGKIQITLEVNEKIVVLKVANNGHSLPENFSIEDHQSLGMTLVKSLSNQLEGTCSVSQTGWTTFEIKFPIAT
ncbi:MAG TPA: PAS domain S-box protein [Saprospiraceae bacterium]|nr:PAS domain S-box protein [Saprospiraceae bacterium]